MIDESIRITSYTLRKYRELRRKGGLVDDLSENPEVHERAAGGLIRDARIVIGGAIEEHIAEPYSAEGFQNLRERVFAGAISLEPGGSLRTGALLGYQTCARRCSGCG